MSRTLRSEAAANHEQAARVQSAHSTREDWRRVLARRDAKRSAVRNMAPARAPARGSVRFGVLAMFGTLAAAMVFAAASIGLTGAKAAAAHRNSCGAPVQACNSASACAAMVSDC